MLERLLRFFIIKVLSSDQYAQLCFFCLDMLVTKVLADCVSERCAESYQRSYGAVERKGAGAQNGYGTSNFSKGFNAREKAPFQNRARAGVGI
jgi:hypothetical protein